MMGHRFAIRLVCAVVALSVNVVMPAGARAATLTVSTMPGDDSGGTNGDFGQTVVAPIGAEVRLLNYQVMVTSVLESIVQSAVLPVDPQSFVIDGPPLWESDLRTVPPTGAVPNAATLSFEPQDLLLDPGATYVLMVRQNGLGNSVLTGVGFRDSKATDLYTEGSLRFIAGQPYPAYPYPGETLHTVSSPWRDLAFSATFSVVPEPLGVAPALALVIAGALRRRRSVERG